jgi:hypothetical protein
MRVDLPAGTDAVLEVTFRCTPLRRLGLTISGASLIIGVGLMIASRTQIQSDSE